MWWVGRQVHDITHICIDTCMSTLFLLLSILYVLSSYHCYSYRQRDDHYHSCVCCYQLSFHVSSVSLVQLVSVDHYVYDITDNVVLIE